MSSSSTSSAATSTNYPAAFSSLQMTYGCSGIILAPVSLPRNVHRPSPEDDDFDVVFTGGVPLSRQTTPQPRTRCSSISGEPSGHSSSGSVKDYKRALGALSIKSSFSRSLASLRKL